jgi:hypothetical protein
MDLEERFEQYYDEFLEFERIPPEERLHPDYTLCGYLKVYSLLKKPTKYWLAAEHDIVYLAQEEDLKELTDEDIIYLQRCGIHCGEYGLADFT